MCNRCGWDMGRVCLAFFWKVMLGHWYCVDHRYWSWSKETLIACFIGFKGKAMTLLLHETLVWKVMFGHSVCVRQLVLILSEIKYGVGFIYFFRLRFKITQYGGRLLLYRLSRDIFFCAICFKSEASSFVLGASLV